MYREPAPMAAFIHGISFILHLLLDLTNGKVTEAPHRKGFAQCSNQAEFRIHFYAQPSGIFPQIIYELILMYLQEDLITVSQYLYGSLEFTKHLHIYCLVGAQ